MIVLAPTPTAAVARVAPFLDFDERYFHGQARMRKHVAEVHQFVKRIDRRGSLWALASRNDFAVAFLQTNDLLANDERFDHQHAVFVEQAWPLAEQLAPGWQVPEVAPLGTSHRMPSQQSAPEVHAPPCGWHSEGGLQTPPVQMFEQHSEGEVHAVSFALQAGPASGLPVPPSTPPSVPPGGTWVRVWQA